MSFNSPRTNRAYSNREPVALCSPFSKSKQMNEIFLDKKTINRKISKLMLEVKDLDSKIFLSKMISYIDSHETSNDRIDQHQVKNFEKCEQNKIQNLLLKNMDGENQEKKQEQHEKIMQNYESQTTQRQPLKKISLSLCPMEVSLDVYPIQQDAKFEQKDMFQTATSDNFFPKKRRTIHVSNPIIEESFSQAQTIQCECGLFEALLMMVSKFMKEEIVKTRQTSEDQCLEIDQAFVEQITKEVIHKFFQKEVQHKEEVQKLKLQLEKTKEALKNKENLLAKQGQVARESLAIREALKLKESQLQQAVEHVSKLGSQLNTLSQQHKQTCQKLSKYQNDFQQLQKIHTALQQQYAALNKQRQQLESKLQAAQKQIQKHGNDKQMYELTKQSQIESLTFQLQLKGHEIQNMKTIIESLEKRKKLYHQEQNEDHENLCQSMQSNTSYESHLKQNKVRKIESIQILE